VSSVCVCVCVFVCMIGRVTVVDDDTYALFLQYSHLDLHLMFLFLSYPQLSSPFPPLTSYIVTASILASPLPSSPLITSLSLNQQAVLDLY
jgi:hypothetical protein